MTRPRLHFTAETGWINDPHGITYHQGAYHVFFQYVPDQVVWGVHCHWGHATGADLLSLTQQPAALAPGDGDAGIWSGSLTTTEDGRAVILYTTASGLDASAHARIRRATPADDNWSTWVKGPVVVDAPDDIALTGFRDPFIRRERDHWRMFVGAGDTSGTAMALSYTSPDLESWAYDGIALQRTTSETTPVWMGTLWECPQIFELDGHAVMVSSVWENNTLHYAGYALGAYVDGSFTAATWGQLTYGDSHYAPSYFTDDDGRPCLLFWMRGIEDPAAGWAGALSIPYVLSVVESRLVATPHPDLEQYRGILRPHHTVGTGCADITWQQTNGELIIETEAARLLTLHRDGDTLTAITVGGTVTFPVDGELRIIVDGPVVEISSRAGLFGTHIPAAAEFQVIATDRATLSLYELSSAVEPSQVDGAQLRSEADR
ncbi:glycoside hydrolase family 32 protein [Microbacterium sp. NPDC056044]|uniref:glycoside hydrolase family 32 protein n=1 Tax=Microbacterium sp. NPDC056044 TaxID=3345690 RepID=UPI0035DAA4BE